MMENLENYGFTLTTDSKDTGKDIEYKITSVELDKKGQKVQKGDTVNITVSVARMMAVKLLERGKCALSGTPPNINDRIDGLTLTLNTEDPKIMGSFVGGDMYHVNGYIIVIYYGKTKMKIPYVKRI